ncbi:MAG: 2-phospho-L-lactate transferase [Thaumarchaeota archaeon]|nr:2-phospho-L-lactate transferase [Nitrososphaerota archaeon]
MSRFGMICGGSGSSKFARAISRNFNGEDLCFIANVADNFWYHGLYVCPDVDILTYALAERLDTSKGWGIKEDTFVARDALSELDPSQSWFGLGDKDLALSISRTELMKQGMKLSEVTRRFCEIFGIKHIVVPATDDDVQTYMQTTGGRIHLQEYWVKLHGEPSVSNVVYVGLNNAKPNKLALDYLSSKVVICPANPITSISPTISLAGVKESLNKARVVAVSPFTGSKPFSGPAGRLMQGLGIEASSYGVAKLYSGFLKLLIVDNNEESSTVSRIKDLGIECVRSNTLINDDLSGQRFVEELLKLF